jgi:magnesium transporter
MIKIYKNSLQEKRLKQSKDYSQNSWISVVSPTGEEITEIRKRLNILSETIQDCLDEFELPRIKVENNNLIVILRAATLVDGVYKTTPLTIIVNDKYITTITLEKLNVVLDLEKQLIEIYTTQKSNFLINISLGVINYYQSYINAINKEVQTQRKKLRKIHKNDIYRLVEMEENLNNFISALVPNINVIKRILTYNYINLYQKDKELIQDLLADGEQVLDICKTDLKTINNVREGYTTVLSIRLNQIIQVLTYLTVFFTIPMVIASIYGMNIELPYSNSPQAFMLLTGVTLGIMAIALSAFIWFKKRL